MLMELQFPNGFRKSWTMSVKSNLLGQTDRKIFTELIEIMHMSTSSHMNWLVEPYGTFGSLE